MADLRSIHLATLDKRRPVLLLTRGWLVPQLTAVVVAPIGTTIRGLRTEVRVGPANGLDHDSVVQLDATSRILRENLGPAIGYLLAGQEADLTAAVVAAFDLEV